VYQLKGERGKGQKERKKQGIKKGRHKVLDERGTGEEKMAKRMKEGEGKETEPRGGKQTR